MNEREEKLYLRAIGNNGISDFVPKPSKEELLEYKRINDWADSERKKAELEGRTILFEIPFD